MMGLDWAPILAGLVGVLSTVVKHYLDKRVATRSEIQRWGRLAYQAATTVGEVTNRETVINRWRDLVAGYAEQAGVKIHARSWRDLEDDFAARWDSLAERQLDEALTSIMNSRREIAKTFEKTKKWFNGTDPG